MRPPDGHHVVLYLRNVNMPQPDKYGTVQLIAFLQQLLTHGGYYDDNQEYVVVERVQVCCRRCCD